VHGTLGSGLAIDLRPRQRFAGYRVRREVHRASATEVYEVQARDRTVYALKVAQAHRGLDQARKMLRHEIAMLNTWAPTPPRSVDRVPLDRADPFAVLEWIDGESLAYRAEKLREAQSTPGFVRSGASVPGCLGVHSRTEDCSRRHPSGNFLVDSRENVRVLDFGFGAKLPTANLLHGIHPGGVLPFVSPEVAAAMLDGGRRMAVRPELDVYAAEQWSSIC